MSVTYCQFGAQTLLARLEALTQEIDSVREGGDIEYIHRMRVASRRLRTALDLFGECLSPKRLRRWEKQFKRITRALGAARDTDVQMYFLGQAIDGAPSTHYRPGLERLLLRLKQRRESLQAEVLKALDKFESSGLSRDMIHTLTPASGEVEADATNPDFDLYQRAYLAVSARLQEVLAFDSLVLDPAHVDELHQMRIAAKHLRYTLEIFAPLYGGETSLDAAGEAALQPYIRIVKTVQEMLGDIHDCDVWMDHVPNFLEEERALAIAYLGHTRSLKRLEPGLNYLKNERKAHRDARHAEFLELWRQHKAANTWPNLLAFLQARITQSLLAPSSVQASVAPMVESDARPSDQTTTRSADQSKTVALIGDIHANLPALEAVLAHAGQNGACEIWNIGDFVGYGPYPDEVVQLLKKENALSIAGNYDLKTLKVKQKKTRWQKSKNPEKLFAFDWAYDHLSPDSRDFLNSLPKERRLTLFGRRILLTHASPVSDEEALTSETPDDRLRELAKGAAADLIIFGHSHQPFTRFVDGVWFVNTGSVGRPDDGDPRACYALLRLEPDVLAVQHHRIEYDTNRTVTAVRDQGLPESFARIFLYGRSLDDLVMEE